jgi:hypothetical protein
VKRHQHILLPRNAGCSWSTHLLPSCCCERDEEHARQIDETVKVRQVIEESLESLQGTLESLRQRVPSLLLRSSYLMINMTIHSQAQLLCISLSIDSRLSCSLFLCFSLLVRALLGVYENFWSCLLYAKIVLSYTWSNLYPQRRNNPRKIFRRVL